MAQRSFLILHGLGGSGPEHWQTWLAAELESAGERVSYPVLPDWDEPQVAQWLETLRAELEPDMTVVCHSLACILWFHAAAAGWARAARVLLVAPPSAAAGVPEIAGFFPVALDADAVANAGGESLLVHSADDPYCPEGADVAYGVPLALETVRLPGAGHLNPDAGFGPWPAALAWCVGDAGPLRAYGAKNGVDT